MEIITNSVKVVVITKDDPSTLQILNARIRRIDLFCKLFGPLAISFINDASVMAAIWATLAMNVLSIFIEYPCIARVSFTIVHRYLILINILNRSTRWFQHSNVSHKTLPSRRPNCTASNPPPHPLNPNPDPQPDSSTAS